MEPADTIGTGSSDCTASTSQGSVSSSQPDISSSVQHDPVQPRNHKFPSRYFGNKQRSFNPILFDKYVWLKYSISQDAVFCYACRFFSLGSANDIFVKTGYRDWKHCTGKTGGLEKHINSMKHKEALASWSDFKVNQQKHTSVASALDSRRKEQVSHNRYYLKTVIELLLFCASQEIGFRGHRELKALNRGNFLELLHLISRHDPAIQARLNEGPKNAIYTSHDILNELLHILPNAVRKIICQGVADAGYFSILADESRDSSKDEQMSFVVRFVGSDGSIQEHFLTYIHAKGLNAESLASYIQDLLHLYDFDTTTLVSQGYDGASIMSGVCSGVQKRVRQFAPYAIYNHCYAHVLNLVLVDSVKSVRSALEFFTLLEVLYVFVSTSKIHVIFKEKQLLCHPNKQPVELQQLSDTRWVCRYAAVNTICCTYDTLLLTIKQVAESSDPQKAIEARGLLHQVKAFSFIISLVMFDRILCCTKQLSDQLQSSKIDLSLASELVVATKSMLADYRTTEYWSKVYKYSTDIAMLHSVDIHQTATKRKRRTPSHLADTVLLESTGSRDQPSKSDEFITQLFFPVLDKFLVELQHRIDGKNLAIMNGIAACSPSSCKFLAYDDLKLFAENYNIATESLEVEVALLSRIVPGRLDIDSLVSDYRTTEYWSKVYKYSTDIAMLHSVDIHQTATKRKRRTPSHLADTVLLESTGSRDQPSKSDEFITQLFFPVLDKFLVELQHRIDGKNLAIMNGIAACSPSSCKFLAYDDLKLFAENYNIATESLEVEVALLSRIVPGRLDIDSLVSFRNYLYSSQPAYESVFKLTQIALTIAVTSAECERSFSTLKRIRTRLRTRMVEERLADLAILAIENETIKDLDFDSIIDQFAASTDRRMALN